MECIQAWALGGSRVPICTSLPLHGPSAALPSKGKTVGPGAAGRGVPGREGGEGEGVSVRHGCRGCRRALVKGLLSAQGAGARQLGKCVRAARLSWSLRCSVTDSRCCGLPLGTAELRVELGAATGPRRHGLAGLRQGPARGIISGHWSQGRRKLFQNAGQIQPGRFLRFAVCRNDEVASCPRPPQATLARRLLPPTDTDIGIIHDGPLPVAADGLVNAVSYVARASHIYFSLDRACACAPDQRRTRFGAGAAQTRRRWIQPRLGTGAPRRRASRPRTLRVAWAPNRRGGRSPRVVRVHGRGGRSPRVVRVHRRRLPLQQKGRDHPRRPRQRIVAMVPGRVASAWTRSSQSFRPT